MGKGFARKAAGLLSVTMICMLLVGAVSPLEVHAAAKKSKTKYSLTVHNLNSNTVLRKGQYYQISCEAYKTKKGVTTPTGIKFKSSKKKVASVSKKGVIKAKKKGKTKITIYCKSKKSKKKTVTVRVGTPVSWIGVSGAQSLRVGYTSKFTASVSAATNKAVSWWSNNTGVATVNSSGKVTAVGPGSATIYAIAKDGSGVMGGSTVNVYSFTKEDAKWVAHRGLHDYYKENTANAFRAAANTYEIWGIECDIWETKRIHVTPEDLPKDPDQDAGVTAAGNEDAVAIEESSDVAETVVESSNVELNNEPIVETQTKVTDTAAAAVAEEIRGLDISSDSEVLDNAEDVKTVKQHYDALTDAQKYEVRTALMDEDLTNPDEILTKFLAAVARVAEYEGFDLVVNHDNSFSRVFGVGSKVWNLTDDQIRSHSTLGSKVCFLSDFIKICKNSGKVPVVEIKGEWNSSSDFHMLTDDGARKTADTIYEIGGEKLLRQTNFISFHADSLNRIKSYVKSKYGFQPYTVYLINNDGSNKINIAADSGYNAVAVTLSMMNDSFYNQARGRGLGVGTWTYRNTSSGRNYLKKHVLSGKYTLEYATIDYDIFH